MSLGTNLQFLRKMRNGMTQEELAEKLQVSRQTVSKWELDGTYPEMDKLVELCNIFSCSLDELVREDMNLIDEAYSDVRMETLEGFHYMKYAVASTDPESDAINHVRGWAQELKIAEPEIIGWDWPYLSQEQINVYNMHGYEAALVVGDDLLDDAIQAELLWQDRQKYLAITIKHPMEAPFRLIPNAYKTVMTHMKINGIKAKYGPKMISCFEKEYVKDGIDYMDVYIAVE
ncbi:MAG: helix-turn-helix transcriptional regulator [Lachnospiraceae bacterium]|nr:helix-turn-helix transcriptional regulator [Lachnospiraceae bacterium]